LVDTTEEVLVIEERGEAKSMITTSDRGVVAGDRTLVGFMDTKADSNTAINDERVECSAWDQGSVWARWMARVLVPQPVHQARGALYHAARALPYVP